MPTESRIEGLMPTAVNAILGEVRALSAQGSATGSPVCSEPQLVTSVQAAWDALAARRTPDRLREDLQVL